MSVRGLKDEQQGPSLQHEREDAQPAGVPGECDREDRRDDQQQRLAEFRRSEPFALLELAPAEPLHARRIEGPRWGASTLRPWMATGTSR